PRRCESPLQPAWRPKPSLALPIPFLQLRTRPCLRDVNPLQPESEVQGCFLTTTAPEMFRRFRERQWLPAAIPSRNIPQPDRPLPSAPSAAGGTYLSYLGCECCARS